MESTRLSIWSGPGRILGGVLGRRRGGRHLQTRLETTRKMDTSWPGVFSIKDNTEGKCKKTKKKQAPNEDHFLPACGPEQESPASRLVPRWHRPPKPQAALIGLGQFRSSSHLRKSQFVLSADQKPPGSWRRGHSNMAPPPTTPIWQLGRK